MSNQENMNFLPENYAEKRQATKTAIIFIGLLLIVIGGIIGAWLFTLYKNKHIFDDYVRVNTEFENASRKIAEFKAMDQERAKMIKKAEITTTLMERVRRFSLIEEITLMRPKGVSFVEINLKSTASDSGARPLTDIEKAQRVHAGLSAEPQMTAQQYDVTVELTATAPTDGQVAEYIKALSKNPLLMDVNLDYSEEFKKAIPASRKDKEGKTIDEVRYEILRKFHVKMKVNPAADLRDISTTPGVAITRNAEAIAKQ